MARDEYSVVPGLETAAVCVCSTDDSSLSTSDVHVVAVFGG